MGVCGRGVRGNSEKEEDGWVGRFATAIGVVTVSSFFATTEPLAGVSAGSESELAEDFKRLSLASDSVLSTAEGRTCDFEAPLAFASARALAAARSAAETRGNAAGILVEAEETAVLSEEGVTIVGGVVERAEGGVAVETVTSERGVLVTKAGESISDFAVFFFCGAVEGVVREEGECAGVSRSSEAITRTESEGVTTAKRSLREEGVLKIEGGALVVEA